MKKLFTVLVAALMVTVTANAQHEIGGIVGGLNGASYKYWFNDALALQADLTVGLTEGVGSLFIKGENVSAALTGKKTLNAGLWDFTINPNVLYHFELPANFKIYTGGGVSFGMLDIMNVKIDGTTYSMAGSGYDKHMGKFGLNAVVGVSYDIQSVPLVLAFDFRPGYGLGFRGEEKKNGYVAMPAYHLSYFDWKLGFAIRYKL